MEGPLLGVVFPDALYNGESIPPELEGYATVYNKVVGAIRLRQVRLACRALTAHWTM